VINPQSVALVQEIVRRESLSMLSYVGDAFPWTTARGIPALERLQQLVRAHRYAVVELGRFLTRNRTPVGYIGSFPTIFTSINFVSLDYVLPRLAGEERRGIAELERDLAGLTDPQAHEQVNKLLKVKKEHLQTLDLLASEYGKPLAS
jgi:hypothetical protein